MKARGSLAEPVFEYYRLRGFGCCQAAQLALKMLDVCR